MVQCLSLCPAGEALRVEGVFVHIPAACVSRWQVILLFLHLLFLPFSFLLQELHFH